jgi:hypothetical protein
MESLEIHLQIMYGNIIYNNIIKVSTSKKNRI